MGLSPAVSAAPEERPVNPIQTSAVPRKSYEEMILDSLPLMPEEGFKLEELKQAMSKVLRNYPDAAGVKTAINRLIRKGAVVVLESRTGRIGSTYKSTLPKPVSTENADTLAEKDESFSNNPQA